jgi:hypothetical protein
MVIILVSFFLFYQNWKIYKETKIYDGQLTTQIEEIIMPSTFETKVLNITNPYAKYDIKYPYFKNADKDFNLNIENLIKTQIEDHKVISSENWQARFNTQGEGENIPNTPVSEEEKFSFFSDFTIVQSNSNYISFILKFGGFSGGAHGYETNVSYNYDVKNQKIIELKDLFQNNPEYLTTLSNISREYLKNQFATVTEEDKKNSSEVAIKEYIDNIVGMIEIGTEPKIENFSIFTFTPDKVKIYFAQYQVGPYSIGMPEFEINRK